MIRPVVAASLGFLLITVGGAAAQPANEVEICRDGRACFPLQIELRLEREPTSREGFDRGAAGGSRYRRQELEAYYQLRMDKTPYTCTPIGGRRNLRKRGNDRPGTDVEHIVALAEAHDSGLRPEDLKTFAADPANLTLAMPTENRTEKSDRDAAEYLPEHNQCWFAARVLHVKQKWELAVDPAEAEALRHALAGCTPAQIARPTCPP